jgi:protein tyrosine/serine phosphatase
MMSESQQQLVESESVRPRRYRRRVWLIAVAALALAFGLAWVQSMVLPKRFAAVDPGRLYRAGTVTPAHLKKLSSDYGVRTVLSLLDANAPETIAERAAAEKLGLRWINVPLPGNGASTPEQRERIKQVLFDDSPSGLLVHCAAGTNRTGLAVGMYRMHRQGWTLDQVRAEMRRFDFEDEPHHENLRQALVAEAALANRQP